MQVINCTYVLGVIIKREYSVEKNQTRKIMYLCDF